MRNTSLTRGRLLRLRFSVTGFLRTKNGLSRLKVRVNTTSILSRRPRRIFPKSRLVPSLSFLLVPVSERKIPSTILELLRGNRVKQRLSSTRLVIVRVHTVRPIPTTLPVTRILWSPNVTTFLLRQTQSATEIPTLTCLKFTF